MSRIREEVKLENEVRASLKNLYQVMRHDPAPIKGGDLFKVLYGSGFKLDRKLNPGEVEAMRDKIEKEYEEGKREDRKKMRSNLDHRMSDRRCNGEDLAL